MLHQKQWNKLKMLDAVMAVQNKEMGLLKASKIYGVPRSTVKDYVKKPLDKVKKLLKVPLGRKTVLPPEIEKELVNYCLIMEKTDSQRRILKEWLFNELLEITLNINFLTKKKSAGRKWMGLFFKRHPNLSMRKPQNLSLARIQGFTSENVDTLYTILKNEWNE